MGAYITVYNGVMVAALLFGLYGVTRPSRWIGSVIPLPEIRSIHVFGAFSLFVGLVMALGTILKHFAT